MCPLAASAQVKVLISGGFSGPYEQLLPEFERTTGIKVTTGSGSSQERGRRPSGRSSRAACRPTWSSCPGEGLTELIAAQPHRRRDGRETLARTPIGVAVRAGAVKARRQHGRGLQAGRTEGPARCRAEQHERHLSRGTTSFRGSASPTRSASSSRPGARARRPWSRRVKRTSRLLPVSEIVHAAGVELRRCDRGGDPARTRSSRPRWWRDRRSPRRRSG